MNDSIVEIVNIDDSKLTSSSRPHLSKTDSRTTTNINVTNSSIKWRPITRPQSNHPARDQYLLITIAKPSLMPTHPCLNTSHQESMTQGHSLMSRLMESVSTGLSPSPPTTSHTRYQLLPTLWSPSAILRAKKPQKGYTLSMLSLPQKGFESMRRDYISGDSDFPGAAPMRGQRRRRKNRARNDDTQSTVPSGTLPPLTATPPLVPRTLNTLPPPTAPAQAHAHNLQHYQLELNWGCSSRTLACGSPPQVCAPTVISLKKRTSPSKSG